MYVCTYMYVLLRAAVPIFECHVLLYLNYSLLLRVETESSNRINRTDETLMYSTWYRLENWKIGNTPCVDRVTHLPYLVNLL